MRGKVALLIPSALLRSLSKRKRVGRSIFFHHYGLSSESQVLRSIAAAVEWSQTDLICCVLIPNYELLEAYYVSVDVVLPYVPNKPCCRSIRTPSRNANRV